MSGGVQQQQQQQQKPKQVFPVAAAAATKVVAKANDVSAVADGDGYPDGDAAGPAMSSGKRVRGTASESEDDGGVWPWRPAIRIS